MVVRREGLPKLTKRKKALLDQTETQTGSLVENQDNTLKMVTNLVVGSWVDRNLAKQAPKVVRACARIIQVEIALPAGSHVFKLCILEGPGAADTNLKGLDIQVRTVSTTARARQP